MVHWPQEALELLPDLVRLRRAIHTEPELGLRTPKTAAKNTPVGAAKTEGHAT